MNAPSLQRKVFTTSRLADFCSEKELQNQIGVGPEYWPVIVLKELMDNALDACEEARVAPEITVSVSQDGIAVADNGTGMEAGTVKKIIDYSIRVSAREAYVSPSRGAQGNGLKCILAMPFVLDGRHGETLIESRKIAHRIVFSVDPVRQIPKIEYAQEPSTIKIGTKITVKWPDSTRSILDEGRGLFLSTAADYTWINPHLMLTLEWDLGKDPFQEIIDSWDHEWERWRPSDPTSPHWYDAARFSRLIGANIADAEDNGRLCPTLRSFIREFRGLTGTSKAAEICETIGAARLSLREFYNNGRGRVADLLDLMCEACRPIKPRELGVIGKDCLAERFDEYGAELETFQYRIEAFEDGGLPYIVEAAFGYCPDLSGSGIIIGINHSVMIHANPFRILGPAGSLDTVLTEQRAGDDEPILVVLHLCCPRLNFLDRGKSAISLPAIPASKVAAVVKAITGKWAKQRKAEERHASARARRDDALIRRDRPMSIRNAAWQVLERAYLDASGNGTLPANPRQIYYAARREVMQLTEKDTLDSKYFTQTLLVDYMAEHGCDWDIAWDDRGHFAEPHTERSFGLGTLNVRAYLNDLTEPEYQEAGFAPASITTCGPAGRFNSLVFIEKEGFLPLFEAVRLAERYDVALLSTKGMSVTAARHLADEICAKYKIPLLILRDFDISGFSISKTIGVSSRRYQFRNEIDVKVLGLRLTDVRALHLTPEPVRVDDIDPDKLYERLERNGATKAEIRFLMNGQRVELNALSSAQMVAFVERKLAEHGIAKVVPAPARLADAYRLFMRTERSRKLFEEAVSAADDSQKIKVPAGLKARLRARLAEHPEEPWDAALQQIVEDDTTGAALTTISAKRVSRKQNARREMTTRGGLNNDD